MPPVIAGLDVDIGFQLPAHFLDLETQRAGFVLLGAFLKLTPYAKESSMSDEDVYKGVEKALRKYFGKRGDRVVQDNLNCVKRGYSEMRDIHHLVWGIVLMLGCGFLGFVTDLGSPGRELLAAGFGVGAGFTLDEFALWIHLRDVYWAEEGRSSFTAVIVALVLGGLILLGVAPLDIPHRTRSVDTLVLGIAIDVFLAALAIAKGKRLLAMLGIFMPVFSLVGAVRLASPRSLWARRFYKPGGRRRARSEARWERIEGRRRWVYDTIAGAPEVSNAGELAVKQKEVARESLRNE